MFAGDTNTSSFSVQVKVYPSDELTEGGTLLALKPGLCARLLTLHVVEDVSTETSELLLHVLGVP